MIIISNKLGYVKVNVYLYYVIKREFNHKTKEMKKQVLIIRGFNFESNKNVVLNLMASNPFMMGLKYLKAIKNVHVDEWLLVNAKGNGGNKGLNAGAYLCEEMEELSGLDLA